MRSHMGLLPQCLCIVRSRAKVDRLEESYVSRAGQRLLWVESGAERPLSGSHIDRPDLAANRHLLIIEKIQLSIVSRCDCFRRPQADTDNGF